MWSPGYLTALFRTQLTSTWSLGFSIRWYQGLCFSTYSPFSLLPAGIDSARFAGFSIRSQYLVAGTFWYLLGVAFTKIRTATENDGVFPECDEKLQTQQQVCIRFDVHLCCILIVLWDAHTRYYDDKHADKVLLGCNGKPVESCWSNWPLSGVAQWVIRESDSFMKNKTSIF